jgi:hypothetical protein
MAPVTAASTLAATSHVAPPSRVHFSDDLPDLLDGRARNRRALLVAVGVAVVVLLGAIVAAIASHYRPV